MNMQMNVFLLVGSIVFSATALAAANSPGVVVTAKPGTLLNGKSSVKSGNTFEIGEALVTSGDATAQARLSDGSMLMLAPLTNIELLSYSFDNVAPKQATVSLPGGQIRAVTGAIPKLAPGQFVVKTLYGTFSAYGTDFSVAVCNAGCAATRGIAEGAYLKVDDGKVVADGPAGSGEFLAGQSGMLATNGAVVILDRTPDGLFDRLPSPITSNPSSNRGPGNTVIIPDVRIETTVPASPAS